MGLRDFTGPSDETILIDDETYSNDIWSIRNTYGVEMARAAILREMSGVFGVYKIDVNRRHLELIADYMVRRFHPPAVAQFDTSLPRPSTEGTNLSIARVSAPTRRLCSRRHLRLQHHSSPTRRCMGISTT